MYYSWFIFAAHGKSTNAFTKSTSFKNKLSDYGVFACAAQMCFMCVCIRARMCVNVETCATTYGKEAIEISVHTSGLFTGWTGLCQSDVSSSTPTLSERVCMCAYAFFVRRARVCVLSH